MLYFIPKKKKNKTEELQAVDKVLQISGLKCGNYNISQ